MTLSELLSHLRENKIKVWTEGDRLRYQGAEGTVTPELLAELRDHKAELIARLRDADAGTQRDNVDPGRRPRR